MGSITYTFTEDELRRLLQMVIVNCTHKTQFTKQEIEQEIYLSKYGKYRERLPAFNAYVDDHVQVVGRGDIWVTKRSYFDISELVSEKPFNKWIGVRAFYEGKAFTITGIEASILPTSIKRYADVFGLKVKFDL